MVSFILEKVCNLFLPIVMLIIRSKFSIQILSSLDASSGENVIESLVSEGLVTVRQEGIRGSTELARLAELESAAKAAGKGKWASSGLQEHVRDIKWSAENPRQLVDKFKGKPVQAVVEHVRDGSTIRAFLLPDFYHITLMVSGIRVSFFSG